MSDNNPSSRRSKKRVVVSQAHVDAYLERLRALRARRHATAEAMIESVNALATAITKAEQRITEAEASLKRIPAAGGSIELEWRSAADMRMPVVARGPYWVVVVSGAPVSIPAKTESGRRGKPSATQLHQVYRELDEEAGQYVLRIMNEVRERERLADRFRRAVGAVIEHHPFDTNGMPPREATAAYRESVLRAYEKTLRELMKESDQEDELLDDLMLEFNTITPTGFGTFAAHWIAKPAKWSVVGPTGPEFRVCLNYSPATGKVLWRPLKSFVIMTPKEEEEGKEGELPEEEKSKQATKDSSKTAEADGKDKESDSNKPRKRKPSGRLTRDHIRFARLGKYGDAVLGQYGKIEAIKNRRDARNRKLMKSFAVIKNLLT